MYVTRNVGWGGGWLSNLSILGILTDLYIALLRSGSINTLVLVVMVLVTSTCTCLLVSIGMCLEFIITRAETFQ